ncbi:MAG: hypothetical protein R2867_36975 [Caldilineaceae bacterium]
MDARGHESIDGVGVVTLINLNDRFSHTRLLCYPCQLGKKKVERHAKTEDDQAALRMAFMEWGLPTTLQADHDSVFYDNRSPSPFPTRLHLWLIALGITFTFIDYNQPTQQGMTERSHQLWHRQVIQGHTFSDWNALFDALLKRRTFSIVTCPVLPLAICHLWMLIPMPFTQAVITLFTSKQRCFLFNGSMTISLAGDGFALFLTTAPSPRWPNLLSRHTVAQAANRNLFF